MTGPKIRGHTGTPKAGAARRASARRLQRAATPRWAVRTRPGPRLNLTLALLTSAPSAAHAACRWHGRVRRHGYPSARSSPCPASRPTSRTRSGTALPRVKGARVAKPPRPDDPMVLTREGEELAEG